MISWKVRTYQLIERFPTVQSTHLPLGCSRLMIIENISFAETSEDKLMRNSDEGQKRDCLEGRG